MLGDVVNVLAQDAAPAGVWSWIWPLLLSLVAAAAAGVLAWLYVRERKRNDGLSAALNVERGKPQQKIVVQSLVDGQREDRERTLQELQIARLRTELELMRRQLSPESQDARAAAREAHELMIEKTRLEIDSLRLHIADLRRRNEDWRGEHE